MKKIVLIVFVILLISILVFLKFKQKTNTVNWPTPHTWTYNGITYEGSYDRYNKIVENAVSAHNPKICDEIDFGQDQGDYANPPEESRYFCRSDYAVKASDVKYCKTLDAEVKFEGTISQRNKCLRDLATKLNDKSLCDFLSEKIYCPFK